MKPHFDGTEFGSITVDGEVYDHDIVIRLNGNVKLGSIRDQMEQVYSKTPPADIPWNIELPPKALVELIEAGQVQPCKTIDLGCGAGNHGIYLAGLGFDVTGVDISPSAIALTEANAKQKGVGCRFQARAALDELRLHGEEAGQP